ncbi:Glycosyl transferase family 2 [Caminicella sporogenes DSM 14501]|uniref:Glycosyl transferase family 2 n=1 Tax=Caminicella sporogenes DSM 14501 TaxID=1121266 RepID=A0A1M6MEZ1_9FIRM|nr:glycosyltransferase [Caminicella sporogenes]RKD27580.1 hypothetical protein BET04_00480 [Caminicella sporogenes]WIF94834.1 glycosyltransferase [Caminicella sporogenes]SHJ81910.1 Glycosyl transferase family 2 [Caminicella sporogenes DSM 14501]
MTKVSVIIPTYNYEKFIHNAIDSILNQTFKDYEIIIVDDGSTDNTAEIIKKYNNEKISYFYKENRGPAAARNLGIKKAKGDYICFLDADDAFMPEKLEIQVDILDKNKNIGLVYTNFLYVKNNLSSTYYHYRCKNFSCHKNALQHLWYENYINTSTVMTVKEYLFKVGLFNENYKYGEDFDLWMRLGKYYEFFCVHKPLVKTRSHDNNLCKSLSCIEKLNYTKKIRNNIKKFYENQGGYKINM